MTSSPPEGVVGADAVASADGAEDLALIRKIRRGDTGAYDRLVRRYLKRAMAIAWEFTGNQQDAEDVVQDSFRRLLDGLPRYDERRPFRPWFFTILRNTARDAIERRERLVLMHVSETLPEAGVSPLEAAIASDRRDRLVAALERLSEMQRQCFRLCAMEGLTSAETGDALGIKEETVRTHVFRARRGLSRILIDDRTDGLTA